MHHPMENLKKKIFKFGMYGKSVDCLSNQEIQLLRDCNWAEFYHKDDLDKILENVEYKPEMVFDATKLEGVHVRMIFSYFKRTISDAKFKEMSSFRIFNHLLISEDFIKQRDLMQIGNVDAKKVSYVLKFLRNNDLVTRKTVDNIVYVKLEVDKLFKESDRPNEPPVIPRLFSRDVPIYMEIKKRLMESETGIFSEDLKMDYGFSIKRGHLYLKNISSKFSDMICIKDVFEGRVRKHLFIRKENVNHTNVVREKNLITVDDRIKALKELLADKKYIHLSDKTITQFKELLGIKYQPDRKTLITTAIKSNLRVFNIKRNNNSCSYIIANTDTQLEDIVTKKSRVYKDDKWSKLILSRYVKNSYFVTGDNMYEQKLSKRAERVCYLIKSQYNFDPFVLSEEFLVEQPIIFMLNIVPFYKANFVDNLMKSMRVHFSGLNNKTDAKSILEDVSIKNVLESPTESAVKREIIDKMNSYMFLKCFLESFWLDCISLYVKEETLIKIQERCSGTTCIDKIIEKNDTKYISYEPSNKRDLFRLVSNVLYEDLVVKLNEPYEVNIQKRRISEKTIFYIPHDDRYKLYHSASTVSSNEEFERLVIRYIQNNKHVARQELIKFFRTKFEIVLEESELINEQSKEYLFTKIKYDLYVKGKIDPVDYNNCSQGLIQEVLNELFRFKYIKSPYRNLELTNIQLREEIKKRLDRKISISIPYLSTFEERDTIYSMYFNLAFDILVVSGTLELDDLLGKCHVFEYFELLNFLKTYADVFEMEKFEDSCLVSIKLNVDPFELL